MPDFLKLLEQADELIAQAQETIEQAEKFDFTDAASRLGPLIEKLNQADEALSEKKASLLRTLGSLTSLISQYQFRGIDSYFWVQGDSVGEYANESQTQVIRHYTLEAFASSRWERTASMPHKFYSLCEVMLHTIRKFVRETSKEHAEGTAELQQFKKQLTELVKKK